MTAKTWVLVSSAVQLALLSWLLVVLLIDGEHYAAWACWCFLILSVYVSYRRWRMLGPAVNFMPDAGGLWIQAFDRARETKPDLDYEVWRQAVLVEASNRQFISYAHAGKRISAFEGIEQVLREIIAGGAADESRQSSDRPNAGTVTRGYLEEPAGE
jgi:hypothetical protein